jgi:GntR family transcriptional regulator
MTAPWPDIRLDHRDALPLHAQLERALRLWLAAPGRAPGTALPDEIGLAKRLQVSRHTVRAALAPLVADGLIARRRGQGTVVAEPPAPASRLGDGFLRALEGAGPDKGSERTTWTAAWVDPPDPATAALLTAPDGVRVIQLDRLRADARGPVLAQRSWLNPHLRLSGAEDFSRPLYAILALVDATPATCDDTLEAITADVALARTFAIRRGLPLFERRRIVRDRAGRILEVAIWHHRPGTLERQRYEA